MIGNWGMQDWSNFAKVTEEVWEEAKISRPSSLPKRESWPETAQNPEGFSSWPYTEIAKFCFLWVVVPVSRKLPHAFWKLDCYSFSKTHRKAGMGRQRSWGLATVGHCTTGEVHLTVVWNHWFIAPSQISSNSLPSMGHPFPLKHEPVTFVLLIKTLSFFLSLTTLATPTLQKWDEIPHWDLMI